MLNRFMDKYLPLDWDVAKLTGGGLTMPQQGWQGLARAVRLQDLFTKSMRNNPHALDGIVGPSDGPWPNGSHTLMELVSTVSKAMRQGLLSGRMLGTAAVLLHSSRAKLLLAEYEAAFHMSSNQDLILLRLYMQRRIRIALSDEEIVFPAEGESEIRSTSDKAGTKCSD